MAIYVIRDRNFAVTVQNPAENRKITQLLRMRLAASEAPYTHPRCDLGLRMKASEVEDSSICTGVQVDAGIA